MNMNMNVFLRAVVVTMVSIAMTSVVSSVMTAVAIPITTVMASMSISVMAIPMMRGYNSLVVVVINMNIFR